MRSVNCDSCGALHLFHLEQRGDAGGQIGRKGPMREKQKMWLHLPIHDPLDYLPYSISVHRVQILRIRDRVQRQQAIIRTK